MQHRDNFSKEFAHRYNLDSVLIRVGLRQGIGDNDLFNFRFFYIPKAVSCDQSVSCVEVDVPASFVLKSFRHFSEGFS